jgi:hypothetical protein
MIDWAWTAETLMWVIVYGAFIGVGYLIASRVADMKAKLDMVDAEAKHWKQLSDQNTEELLELQEDYQNLYRRDAKLRDAVKVHRAANDSNCNDMSCEKGCGHDLRLYTALDETDVSVAGLFPKLSAMKGTWPALVIRDEVDWADVRDTADVSGDEVKSVWDAMREGLPDIGPVKLDPLGLGEVPDEDLPGMWERADFEGGQEREVRGPDWTPEEGS